MKSLSVVVPTCNKARYLQLTLASFEAQRGVDYELIIVDDGSGDATPDVVASYRDRLPIKYRRQNNRGRAHARNAALELAEGEVIVFSDDDRILAPEFLREHALAFEAPGPAPVVMGWQRGILTSWRDDLAIPATNLWELVSRRVLGKRLGDRGPIDLVTPDDLRERFDITVERYWLAERWWDEVCLPAIAHFGEGLEGMRVPWLLGTTGNLSALRQDIVDVGRFDEGFVGWGLEDLDLCYRLHHAGRRSIVSRRAVNFHQAHPSGSGRRAQWLRNLLHLMTKYEALDVAMYGYQFTRADVVDLRRFNDMVLAVEREPAAPPLHQALRRAYLELVTARIGAVERSGGARLVGIVHEEW
jgi:glycosyltransferase involved in cell wall biosynthesis